jgi:hypothetical protein
VKEQETSRQLANPKLEIRNLNQQCPKPTFEGGFEVFSILNFVSDFEFGISDLFSARLGEAFHNAAVDRMGCSPQKHGTRLPAIADEL